jgi:hypothetical protein
MDVNTYLQDVLEIDPTVANSDLRQAIMDQGLDDFDTMHLFTEDQLKDAFHIIKSPGGFLPGVLNVRNRGFNITTGHQTRIKQMVYYARYSERVQRDWDDPDNNTLQEVWSHKTVSEGYDNDVDVPSKMSNIKDIKQTIENLESYFSQKLGQDQIPLAYVTRDIISLPGEGIAADEDDPGLGLPDFMTEMIRRSRHNGQYWDSNKSLVWRTVRAVFYGTEVFAYIKKFEIRRNGRDAYISIKGHYVPWKVLQCQD